MSTVRTSDTGPELRIRRLLHADGLRYRVNTRPSKDIRSYPDVVFPRAKVAVFIDGCFWHGCPDHASWPKSNGDWWREKIDHTRRRDSDLTSLLTNAGWHVVRVWEHESPETAAGSIASVVRARTAVTTNAGTPHVTEAS